jgi:geranylgeranylglycerol-phosphate geranylgeranyltransferase
MTSWKERAWAHVETWRLYTSCYAGVVGLAGASLGMTHPGGWLLLAAWGIPTMGWLAGLYGGDYFDRKLDAISKPQRPIPSGLLTPGTALACMIGLISASAALVVLLNWHVLALVAIATPLGLSYNGYFKARGFAGNLVRGSLTALVFLFGVLIVGGRIDVTLIAVATVFMLQDTSSNLVGALRDVAGDRAGGYLTYPVRRGVARTVMMTGALVAAWSILAVLLAVLDRGHRTTPFTVALLAAMALSWLVVFRLTEARAALSRQFALRMHDVLCLERIVLAAAFVAWGAGALRGTAIGIPALAVTWLSQRSLRARYEFPGHGFRDAQGRGQEPVIAPGRPGRDS